MRSLDGPQQLRLQFRAVLLQVQRLSRLQRHLLVSVRENDEFAATSLSDEMSKLSLRLQNCNRFHGVNVTGSAVESNIRVDLVPRLEPIVSIIQ
jgi:hypothetical protein